MVTISALRSVLNQPVAHFKRLRDVVWEEEQIVSSTLFAQARVKLRGGYYLLCMPLQGDAMQRVEHFLPLNKHLHCGVVPRIEILREEMRYTSSRGTEHFCDILLEPLPDALPLKDAIATAGGEDIASLRSAVDALQEQLHKADISHNNLRTENILIDRLGALYPIRWFYATGGKGGDDAALESLRATLDTLSNEEQGRERDAVIPAAALDKYIYAGNLHEGLIVVESEAGWGFVNCNCEEVIKPQYIWANDFCEGRAEVQTESGMGLIDKEGNYILDPIYEDVEFDVREGLVRACQDNKQALFDYSGRQLCEWDEIVGGG